MRLNKYIAHQNIASRREADRLIKEGHVYVNGNLEINPATDVTDDDKVVCNLDNTKKKICIKLFKPRGVVVSKNRDEGKPIYKLIENDFTDLYPVGRLDKESSGLIILTNDGVLSRQILSPEVECEKEYYVKVDMELTDGALKRLEYGINLDGRKLKKAEIKRIDKISFYITLVEGRNRQIRRMCNKVDCNVIMLKRIRIAGVKLETLEIGKWKYLTKEEIDSILKLKQQENTNKSYGK